MKIGEYDNEEPKVIDSSGKIKTSVNPEDLRERGTVMDDGLEIITPGSNSWKHFAFTTLVEIIFFLILAGLAFWVFKK